MGALKTLVAVATLAGCAALGAPGAARAASFDCSGGAGIPLQVDVATIPVAHTTSSKTFVGLPGARLTLGTGSCVRVQFSAQIKARRAGLRIRLAIDGQPAGAPNIVNFHTTGPAFDNRTATFIVRNLPPKMHTIAIHYSSADGKPVVVTKGVMTVWWLTID
jgi:hypothetical protein